MARFRVEHGEMAWNDLVVEVISLGQRVGYGWMLWGDVLGQQYGETRASRIPGVDGVIWELEWGDAATR